jgi:hypothetical protein
MKTETHFQIPLARNLNFVGRDKILKDLEKMVYDQQGGQRRAALYGLGGVG